MYWPCFVIATAGALIGSQSLITSTFSIVRQAMRLNCFPPVRILHTGEIPNHQCAPSQFSSLSKLLYDVVCGQWVNCSHPLFPPPPSLKMLYTDNHFNVVLSLHTVTPQLAG